MTRRELCGAGAFALARPPVRPNIVIVYVDELRATALKLYRPDGIETPNLARLASRGVLFQNAFTPHPLCVPARVSLWTGQYTHTHGSRCNQMFLRDDRETMAGILKSAGYRLGIFGKNHCFTPAQLERWFAADFSLGSKAWNQALSPDAAAQIRKHRQWIRDLGGMPGVASFPPDIFDTHLINQRAMEFIEREAGSPFAAWISIPDPHAPVQTPEEFARIVPPERVQLPPLRGGEMKTKNTRMQIYDYLIRGSELEERFLRQFVSIYYGMVAHIDREVGRLMALLERKGLVENTAIVFTSDHGDFAAEHRLIYKTGSMVDSLVHIPLLVSWPGRVPEGRREAALVSHVDLMPTLLDFCGLPVPRAAEGRRLPFREGDERRTYVYSEYGNGDPEFTWAEARAVGQAKRLGTYSLGTKEERDALAKRERAGHLRMIRTATHKLIRDSNGETEFYHLAKDPYELDNVHGRPEYRTEERELAGKLA